MPEAAVVPIADRNPPVDYAVAVWLGTPKEEIEKGLREGWIRRPGVDWRAWTEEREGVASDGASVGTIASPPLPDTATDSPSSESPSPDTRTRIEALLRRLDPARQARTFADAWNEAGADDAMRTGRFIDFLGRALNAPQDVASELTTQLESLEQTAGAMHASALRNDDYP